jgi:hypothetical protein
MTNHVISDNIIIVVVIIGYYYAIINVTRFNILNSSNTIIIIGYRVKNFIFMI